MRSSFMPKPPARSRPGFSLVELLTVIAIMCILMTVASVGIGGLIGGKGVSSAVSTTEAVFEEARSLAVGKRTNAAVLISVQDPYDSTTYLHRVVVAYKEIDPLTNQQSKSWTLSSRGVTLPSNVYFSRTLSRKEHNTGAGEMPKVTLDGANVKKEYLGEYFIYEFNAEGLSTTPGASFVVGMGARTPGGSETKPHVIKSSKRDFGGFIVWRNGSTSLFRHPSQIIKGGDNITYF